MALDLRAHKDWSVLWAKRAWRWGVGSFMQVKELMDKEKEGIFACWLPWPIAARGGRSTERSFLRQEHKNSIWGVRCLAAERSSRARRDGRVARRVLYRQETWG